MVDAKSKQWLEDSTMNKYLRPATLFGNKFDDYLNEYVPTNPKKEINEYEETRRKLAEIYGNQ